MKGIICFIFLLALSLSAAPIMQFKAGEGYSVHGDTLDVGSVPRADSLQVSVNIANSGDSILKIPHMRSTCPCFKIKILQNSVEQDKTVCVFTIKVISEGLENSFCKKVYLHTNIPDNEITSIFVRGKIE